MQWKSHSFENTISWPPSSLLLLLDMSCNTGSSCDMCSTIFWSKLCHKYSLPISMFPATVGRKRLYKLGSFNGKCTKYLLFSKKTSNYIEKLGTYRYSQFPFGMLLQFRSNTCFIACIVFHHGVCVKRGIIHFC